VAFSWSLFLKQGTRAVFRLSLRTGALQGISSSTWRSSHEALMKTQQHSAKKVFKAPQKKRVTVLRMWHVRRRAGMGSPGQTSVDPGARAECRSRLQSFSSTAYGHRTTVASMSNAIQLSLPAGARSRDLPYHCGRSRLQIIVFSHSHPPSHKTTPTSCRSLPFTVLQCWT
jgi:hypothetical protein